MRHRPPLRFQGVRRVACSQLGPPQLQEQPGIVRLELRAARPEPDRGLRILLELRIALQLGHLVRAGAVDDARRGESLLHERHRPRLWRHAREERRVRRGQGLQVGDAVRVRCAERDWPARLPEEADRRAGGGVGARSRLAVEARRREQAPEIGEELQIVQRPRFLVHGELAEVLGR